MEMENISRWSHLRGFCHYPHRGVDARLQSARVQLQTPLFPLFYINVMYRVRVTLWTVKIFLAEHQREGGRVGNLCISLHIGPCFRLTWTRLGWTKWVASIPSTGSTGTWISRTWISHAAIDSSMTAPSSWSSGTARGSRSVYPYSLMTGKAFK